jgi:hypothetical protein
MKIFIANVPHNVAEAELDKMLRQFSDVTSVKLLTDK